MTSLDGINGRSTQTLLKGENDSKQSDEFQATGEGVELTVHKESLVVEEIKEVDLRPPGAQLFMTEIRIELDHAVMHLADFR